MKCLCSIFQLRVCHKLTSKLKREVVLGSSSLDDPLQFITVSYFCTFFWIAFNISSKGSVKIQDTQNIVRKNSIDSPFGVF